MGNFSKPPADVLSASRVKGYVGVHFEQGVPLLDRDLNLMNDLITDALRSFIRNFIGNGVLAESPSFQIEAIPADNDFRIRAGSVLVAGREVLNPANITYKSQPGVPTLTTPPGDRGDIVYLDRLDVSEVDGNTDPELKNSGDVGLQTSVRQILRWVVRVAEGTQSMPAPAAGHTHFVLAQLRRPPGQAEIGADMITDLRQTISKLADIDRRLRILEKPAFAVVPPPQNQFNPKSGAPGTNVTLFGKNFNLGGLRVHFDSSSVPGAYAYAVIVGEPTDTQVVVKVPEMPAGQHKITVQYDSIGYDVSDEIFIISPQGSPPALTRFQPRVGVPGTSVTLFGSNFAADGLKVFFGTVQAQNPSRTSGGDQITVKVPTMPTMPVDVNIRVETNFGTDTSDTTFKVRPPGPAPTLTRFSLPSGAPGTFVDLFGSNFTSSGMDVNVRFGDVPAIIVGPQGETFLTVVVPTMPAMPVDVSIRVETIFGSATSSSLFKVENPGSQPAFRSPTPFSAGSGAPGTKLTLFGSNFNAAGLRVTFLDLQNLSAFIANIAENPTAAGVVIKVPAVTRGRAYVIRVQTTNGTTNSQEVFVVN